MAFWYAQRTPKLKVHKVLPLYPDHPPRETLEFRSAKRPLQRADRFLGSFISQPLALRLVALVFSSTPCICSIANTFPVR